MPKPRPACHIAAGLAETVGQFAKVPHPMFRRLSDKVFASPQIEIADLAEAGRMGVTLVINNRPEGESDDQTAGAKIEAAARQAGMDYLAIPVTHAGFSENQVQAMAQALERAQGPVLAYCRSGTRSTLLWALAEASSGADPAGLAEAAGKAGYDLTPIQTVLDMLAARRG